MSKNEDSPTGNELTMLASILERAGQRLLELHRNKTLQRADLKAISVVARSVSEQLGEIARYLVQEPHL